VESGYAVPEEAGGEPATLTETDDDAEPAEIELADAAVVEAEEAEEAGEAADAEAVRADSVPGDGGETVDEASAAAEAEATADSDAQPVGPRSARA
jgi:hypothetical protein